jgi:Arc/MetJ family transcription regulator
MRTNVVLDDELVEEGFKVSSAKTKRELIREALKEFVENRNRLDLHDLAGRIRFSNGYDYKKMREEQ